MAFLYHLSSFDFEEKITSIRFSKRQVIFLSSNFSNRKNLLGAIYIYPKKLCLLFDFINLKKGVDLKHTNEHTHTGEKPYQCKESG